jgi:hypothetical protein
MSEKTRGNENLFNGIFDGVGKYDMPVIQAYNGELPQQFISYNYAASEKNTRHKGIHFFLDDYQFFRTWSTPNKYIELFKRFDCVCSPDFSLYADYPLALQIYNHYRKQYLGAFYQMNGVNIIPTVGWSDSLSYEFCFDGIPKDSIVAVANTGCVHGEMQRALFKDGYYEMLDRLTPTKVLFFGQIPDYLQDEDNIISIGNSHSRFAKFDNKDGD